MICASCGRDIAGLLGGRRLCGRCHLLYLGPLRPPPPPPEAPPRVRVKSGPSCPGDEAEAEETFEDYVIDRRGGLIYRRRVSPPEPPAEGRPRLARARREVERWLKACPGCGRGFVGAPQRTTCSDACRVARHRQRLAEAWREWATEALAICRRGLENLERGQVSPATLAALRARAQSLHPSSLRRRALLTIERVERYGVGALEGDLNRSASHRLRAWQPPT